MRGCQQQPLQHKAGVPMRSFHPPCWDMRLMVSFSRSSGIRPPLWTVALRHTWFFVFFPSKMKQEVKPTERIFQPISPPTSHTQDIDRSSPKNACCCFCCYSVLSRVSVFTSQRIAAHQASLSFTIFQILLKLVSIEQVMPSNHLLLCCPPSPPAFNLSQHQGRKVMSQLFAPGSQSIGASASAPIFPMNIQGCFPLGLTCLLARESL